MSNHPSSPELSSLPPEITEALAIVNALSIGEQPAILANLALANQILNQNLEQQEAIANQQAMNQIQMATVAKAVELIAGIDPADENAVARLQQIVDFFAASGSGRVQPHDPAASPASPVSADPHAASTSASEGLGPIIQSLAQTALKVVGEMPALLASQVAQVSAQNAGLMMQNAVAQQQALATLQQEVLKVAVAILNRATARIDAPM
jgi:Killing trait